MGDYCWSVPDDREQCPRRFDWCDWHYAQAALFAAFVHALRAEIEYARQARREEGRDAVNKKILICVKAPGHDGECFQISKPVRCGDVERESEIATLSAALERADQRAAELVDIIDARDEDMRAAIGRVHLALDPDARGKTFSGLGEIAAKMVDDVDRIRAALAKAEADRDAAFRLITKCTMHADNGHAVYLMQKPFKALLDYGRALIAKGVK